MQCKNDGNVIDIEVTTEADYNHYGSCNFLKLKIKAFT